MFERFTDGARQVVVAAQAEARALGHGHIGTEHLMLGLLRDSDGLAGGVLRELGVDPGLARDHVTAIRGVGEGAPPGRIPFTPRSKRVFDMALREALALGHAYIGTEHLLLALVFEGEGVGARVLTDAGADAGPVRARITELLRETRRRRDATEVAIASAPTPPVPGGVDWPAALAAAAASFAESRSRPAAVRVTLAEGERILLAAIEVAADGLLWLTAHPDADGAAGSRLVLVRPEAILWADVTVDDRGDRGFRGP